MIIEYGSPAYLLFIFASLAVCALLYLFLRKKSARLQKNTVLALMLVNLFQHLFKSVIYPHITGGFNALSTAYNMCALLIIISPLALIFRVTVLRDFVFYAGSVAGIIAVAVPYWSIGKPATDPDYIRSFICHTLLFATSLLPLLLKLHRPSYKCFWRIGLCFFAALGLIILNDVLCILVGIYPGTDGMSVGEALALANPVWSFGPPESFAWAKDVAGLFLPDALVGKNGGTCVPVLWYAVPIYIIITVAALPICIAVDRKRFRVDRNEKSTKK